MKKLFTVSLVFVLLLIGSQAAFGIDDGWPADVDAFWAEVSRTVAEGDFEGYAATYHEDAILVSGLSETTYPIAQALDGWKQGFVDTAAGKMKASVEFRFTRRLSDPTTAHETGMFHYAVVDADGERTEQFIHFEALLIKKPDWKMMMEYQKSPATQEEWDAAK
ncbi:YybH family protein [Gemmatimonadota bacterium]